MERSSDNTNRDKQNRSGTSDRTTPQESHESSSQRKGITSLSPTAAVFNPQAPELTRTWHTHARMIFAVNTYPNGITLSVHSNEALQSEDAKDSAVQEETGRSENLALLPNQFHLRLKDTKEYQLPTGKYFLYKENYAETLEKHFSNLQKQGVLGMSVVYIGTTTDPFLNFQKRFDATMSALEVCEQYRPGLVVVQTRSPMVIAALPLLKMLGSHVIVAMPIETRLETSILRYTPGQPRISERLIAAEGLRRQGIAVNLVASPMLPYGDYYRDAWEFAQLLDKHADYVSFGSLATGYPGEETQLKSLPLAQKLVADQQFKLLRPHSYRYVYYAMTQIAPQKLLLPTKVSTAPSQLNLFAA